MKQQYDYVWIATDGLIERHPCTRQDVTQALTHYRKRRSWFFGYDVAKYDRGIGIYDKDMNCLKFFIKREESHL